MGDISSLNKYDNKEVIEYIFKNHYEQMFRFALSYVYDYQIAEDIVHDVLLKFIEQKNKLQKNDSLFSYLLSAVKNKSIDYIRKYNIEDERKNKLLEASLFSDTIEYHIDDELLKIIYNAIEELPEQCRKVFKMNVIDGLKYKEVAEELNISINSVKVQKNRAVKNLKEKVFALRKNPFLFFFLKKTKKPVNIF